MKVRMMLPMSVRCNTCGNFMYKGTKFNTRMEDVRGETYLGIRIFRFYYRCTNCSAEFCMKTDPQSTDYIVEGGATRNYEPWREKERTTAAVRASREDEEKGNAMKALENRTLDSKREMDIMTALDEMKSLKSRHEAIDTEDALAALKRSAGGEEPVDLDAEDEEAVRQMLLERAGFVRRLSDSDGEKDLGGPRGMATESGTGEVQQHSRTKRTGENEINMAKKKARNKVGLSVAAAAWDEELSSGDANPVDVEDTKGRHNNEPAQEVQNDNNGTSFAASAEGIKGKTFADHRQDGRAVRESASLLATPPSSVPRFGSNKVPLVAVRKKAGAHNGETRGAKGQGGSDGGVAHASVSGEGGLMGLAAYGSESD